MSTVECLSYQADSPPEPQLISKSGAQSYMLNHSLQTNPSVLPHTASPIPATSQADSITIPTHCYHKMQVHVEVNMCMYVCVCACVCVPLPELVASETGKVLKIGFGFYLSGPDERAGFHLKAP